MQITKIKGKFYIEANENELHILRDGIADTVDQYDGVRDTTKEYEMLSVFKKNFIKEVTPMRTCGTCGNYGNLCCQYCGDMEGWKPRKIYEEKGGTTMNQVEKIIHKTVCEKDMKIDVLNKIRDIVHENAVNHGWWEEPRSFGDIIALCHSELSEALEEFRNAHPVDETYFNGDKPEGIPIELADCIIRILDFCGKANINIDEAVRRKQQYNISRPYKHGGKVI